MIQAKCVQKFRDKTGKIYGYRLMDLNNQTQDVRADNLKLAIKNKKIHIVNLTLTSDNRLVDCHEHILEDKSLGDTPNKPMNKLEALEKWFRSIAEYSIGVFGAGDLEMIDTDNHEGKILLMAPILGIDTIQYLGEDQYIELILDLEILKKEAKIGGGICYMDGNALDISLERKIPVCQVLSSNGDNAAKELVDTLYNMYTEWKSNKQASPLYPEAIKVIEAINKGARTEFKLACSGRYNGVSDIYAYYMSGTELVLKLFKTDSEHNDYSIQMVSNTSTGTSKDTGYIKISRDSLTSIIDDISKLVY